jgi:hypothetical protein
MAILIRKYGTELLSYQSEGIRLHDMHEAMKQTK